MTTFAAPVHPGFAAVPADAVANGRTASPVDSARPGATGITLVGEIVNLDTAGDTPDTSTVSVRWLGVTVHPAGDNAGIPLTPGTAPTADRPPRPAGLRGLTEGIRRLIDGPQGRHRAPPSVPRLYSDTRSRVREYAGVVQWQNISFPS